MKIFRGNFLDICMKILENVEYGNCCEILRKSEGGFVELLKELKGNLNKGIGQFCETLEKIRVSLEKILAVLFRGCFKKLTKIF